MFNKARNVPLSSLVLAGVLFAMCGATQAQAQNSRPVRLIVGFPPGTAPDTVARIVTQKLQETTQQSFVVENVSGVGGLLGAQQAAKAAPDGHTLFLNTVSDMSIAPHIYRKLAYNPSDFELVSHLVYADVVLTVPTKIPVQNLKEYVSWARQQKPLFMGTFGPGTPAHFGTVIFGGAFDLKPEPVHYRNTSDAMTGVLSGDIPGIFATSSLAAPYVKQGKLRALAVTAPTRMASLPDVPTFAELGHPEAVFASWFGIAAPPKTPAATLDKLSEQVRKALRAPDVREKLETAGFRITGTTRDEFARIVRDETTRWGKAAQITGFKAD